MAAFKFFNIGKANDEIARLEAQVADLNKQITDLKANGPEVEAAAETLRGELEAERQKAAKAEIDLATVNSEKDKAVADLAAANAKLAAFPVEVKTAAAAQAAQITASIGVPPVAATPATPPEPAKNLTGLDRAIAAHKAKQTSK